ncbi:G patch domain-containing protein 1 [Chionoecetes opilio]|uniref:G patch domain-containing protein 1 n=1 Tax=Chionoecetes opilio TaxID=41210 RepID=A0A8J4XU14_CHIOP|nr:G patch domain-containing protein 1 [Chionoecetes opilio]
MYHWWLLCSIQGCYAPRLLWTISGCYDDVRARKAPRVEDQVVTDKQGRRRFHGAFTGGFSAGYFNSVGTKEGWAPAAFVSSKGQRGEAKQSRPQDYMDDEDLEAFGIAPQGIRASADFDGSQQVKRKRVTDASEPIPGTPVLEDLLRPTRETMGMKLLRRLGWRPGQGVGPRVSRRQKVSAQKEKRRLLASQGPAPGAGVSESEGDSDDETMKDVTFAPSDVPELSAIQPKMDQFGLGYTPLSRTPVLGGHVNLFDPAPLSLTEKKKKLLIKGQAFGVGAFEDEDEDIYATEDMSNYDFGEQKDAKSKGKARQDQQNLAVLGLVKALAGFRLSSRPEQKPKVYPPPPLPPGFTPHHTPHRRRFEQTESELRGLGRHTMTAEQRAHIIAEKPKATVEIRSGVKGQNQLPPTPPPKESKKTLDTSDVDKIYEEFKNSDNKLSTDFKPFGSVPEKQKRYELFLKMKQRGQKDRFYLAQPKAMTEWEREREAQEFNRAAKLFLPLASSMATRFVTAATSEADHNLKDGLNVNIPKPLDLTFPPAFDITDQSIPTDREIRLFIYQAETKAGKEGLLDPIEPGDERTAAARSGMYGKLTHTTEEWYPDNLLCRRFNVPNPYPDSSFIGVVKAKKEKLSLFGGFHTDPEETAGLRTSGRGEEEDMEEQEPMVQQGDRELDDRPEDYGLKVPVDGPPTMDLFKAIFQDSDSDSETENTSSPKRDDRDSSIGSSSHPITSSDPRATTHEGRSGEVTGENVQTSTTTKPGQRRVRSSRFEPLKKDIEPLKEDIEPLKEDIEPLKEDIVPLKEDITSENKEPPKPTNQPEDIATLTFIPRKKEEPIPPVTHGIFANVDFVALNSYRNQGSAGPDKEAEQVKHKWPEAVIKAGQDKATNGDSSSSSTDSEDVYGPPAPSHLKNRAQMIQSGPPVTRVAAPVGEAAAPLKAPGWVEKEGEQKSEKNSKSITKKHKLKARSKSKSKKEKKKKDKKSKKHKEKKKKKGRRSSSKRRRSKGSSSSSRSESSSSESD